MEYKIENVNDVKNFMFAGNAIVTVKSKKSGDHVTFKIRKPKENMPYFVSVLTGSDNTGDFTYLGTVFESGNGKKYCHGKKSRIGMDSKSNKVFGWVVDVIQKNVDKLIEQAEIYHEGRCGRCGRRLTVPESIIDGLGPECKKKSFV